MVKFWKNLTRSGHDVRPSWLQIGLKAVLMTMLMVSMTAKQVAMQIWDLRVKKGKK